MGCRREVPAPCLAIPDAAVVERVDVTTWQPDGQRRDEYRIWDGKRIEALLARLRAEGAAVCRTFEKKRAEEITVAFTGDDDVLLVIWIGRDWMGGVDRRVGTDGSRLARWRPLAPQERASLVALLQPEQP